VEWMLDKALDYYLFHRMFYNSISWYYGFDEWIPDLCQKTSYYHATGSSNLLNIINGSGCPWKCKCPFVDDHGGLWDEDSHDSENTFINSFHDSCEFQPLFVYCQARMAETEAWDGHSDWDRLVRGKEMVVMQACESYWNGVSRVYLTL